LKSTVILQNRDWNQITIQAVDSDGPDPHDGSANDLGTRVLQQGATWTIQSNKYFFYRGNVFPNHEPSVTWSDWNMIPIPARDPQTYTEQFGQLIVT
jgi:hypothetical protein